jgi:hypothetical protein
LSVTTRDFVPRVEPAQHMYADFAQGSVRVEEVGNGSSEGKRV